MANPRDNDTDVFATVQSQLRMAVTDNEVLKNQLMNMSLINELIRVLHSSTDLDGITKTILLGIQEIVGFDRVILFTIDKQNFQLVPDKWVGMDERQLNGLKINLGFEGGEITDSIFLNRHIIVESADPAGDFFSLNLGSKSYLVMPLLSKVKRKCYEVKNCSLTNCPAHGGYNPYCWSIPGAGLMVQSAVSEDERRKQCIRCACFKCEGVLWMDKQKKGGVFTSDEISMLSAINNVAGLVMENYRIFNALEIANTDLKHTNDQLKVLNRDLQIAQAKINADLEHARKIQTSLLPQELPDSSDFSISAKYIPAAAVGGDYYDVFEISPGIFGIVVADVSGHGVASSLIMSMVKILLKAYSGKERSPQKTLEYINRTFLTEVKTDNFVTVFYGVMDINAHTLNYSSAGHCPLLLYDRTAKQFSQLKADGLFLGIFEDMMLNESSLTYKPGQTRMALFTDGLIEGRNRQEEMFDLPRLQLALLRSMDMPPRKAMEAIIADQKSFCEGKEPEDDITVLVIDF